MSFTLGILSGVLICIASLLAIALCRSFTTLCHEFGHAIPALVFTDDKVEVFIGSYGDKEKGSHFKLGRLDLYFKIDLFGLNLGLCTHKTIPGFLYNLIILLGGPFTSLLIALPLFYFAMTFSLSMFWIFLIGVFAVAAIMDLVINLFPSSRAILLSEGQSSYNDGMAIYQLIIRQFQSKNYFALENLLLEKKYDQLIDEANNVLLEGKDDSVSYLLIQAYLEQKDYNNVLSVYEELKRDRKMKYDDFLIIGMAQKAKGNYLEALKNFDYCFNENPVNAELNQAIGEIKADLGEHKRAIQRFTASIYYDEKNYFGYIERAKVYIKESLYDAAQKDLEFASDLVAGNFEIAYNLGVVYEKQRLYAKSVKSFQEAEKLMPDQPGLAFKIELLKEHLPRE